MGAKPWNLRRGGLTIGLSLGVAAALGACSADSGDGSSDSGRTGPGPGDFNNAPPAAAPGATPGDFGNTNTVVPGSRPVLNPSANTPPGTLEFSYIWIANTLEGTVSKLDTRLDPGGNIIELARYLTSPTGTGLPSRTSVGDSGDVVVANRGGASNAPGGDGAGVIKIYARPDNCIDTNGNGMIDTSTGATDIRAWGEDECVAWFTPLAFFSNRPVAWAPAPAPDAPADVWTAGAGGTEGQPCNPTSCGIDVLRLDGATGAIKDRVTVTTDAGGSPLAGVDMLSATIPFAGMLLIDNYGPYGGAADGGGNFWTFTANTTHLIRIDAVTLQPRVWPIQPAGNGYGITIDEKGRIHLCGSQGISRFSPGDETWMSSPPGPILGFNGCMTDGAGKIWVGGGADNGDPGLHGFDAETLQTVASYPLGAVKGVSIDVEGFVWGVGSAGFLGLGAADQNRAWKVDPNTGDFWTYDGLNGAYSYSDMTGFGLSSAGVQPPLE